MVPPQVSIYTKDFFDGIEVERHSDRQSQIPQR